MEHVAIITYRSKESSTTNYHFNNFFKISDSKKNTLKLSYVVHNFKLRIPGSLPYLGNMCKTRKTLYTGYPLSLALKMESSPPFLHRFKLLELFCCCKTKNIQNAVLQWENFKSFSLCFFSPLLYVHIVIALLIRYPSLLNFPSFLTWFKFKLQFDFSYYRFKY